MQAFLECLEVVVKFALRQETGYIAILVMHRLCTKVYIACAVTPLQLGLPFA